MEKIEVAHYNQLFVKYVPDYLTSLKKDYESHIQESIKAINNANTDNIPMPKLINKVWGHIENIRFYQQLNSQVPDLDFVGMDKFWILQKGDNFFTLRSIRTSETDPIQESFCLSLKDVFKHYRSLESIIEEEPLIGKKIKTYNDEDEYVLYELENVIIVCFFDENKKIKEIKPIPRYLPDPVLYDNGPLLKMKEPKKILKLVYDSIK